MKTIKFDQDDSVFNHMPFFTEAEEKKIIAVLPKGVSDDDRHWFIEGLRYLCARVLEFRESPQELKYKRPCKTDLNKAQKEAIKVLETASAMLRKIADGNLKPRRAWGIADQGRLGLETPIPESNKINEDNSAAINSATASLAYISTLLEIFQTATDKRKGNKTINIEFAQFIAEDYREYVGEPTSKKNEPFVQILDIVFNAAGIKIKDLGKLARDILHGKADRPRKKTLPKS